MHRELPSREREVARLFASARGKLCVLAAVHGLEKGERALFAFCLREWFGRYVRRASNEQMPVTALEPGLLSAARELAPCLKGIDVEKEFRELMAGRLRTPKRSRLRLVKPGEQGH